jgi:hypothetical protein
MTGPCDSVNLSSNGGQTTLGTRQNIRAHTSLLLFAGIHTLIHTLTHASARKRAACAWAGVWCIGDCRWGFEELAVRLWSGIALVWDWFGAGVRCVDPFWSSSADRDEEYFHSSRSLPRAIHPNPHPSEPPLHPLEPPPPFRPTRPLEHRSHIHRQMAPLLAPTAPPMQLCLCDNSPAQLSPSFSP